MTTKTKKLISWKACGFDNADRKGSVGPKEEVQIRFSRGKHEVSFHHATKGIVDSMEEAKDYAEANIEQWMEARAKERAQYEAQRIAESRRAADAQQRQTDLVNQLRALGVDARDGIGIQLSHEAAQEILRRLQERDQVAQFREVTPVPVPLQEAGIGSEMRMMMC